MNDNEQSGEIKLSNNSRMIFGKASEFEKVRKHVHNEDYDEKITEKSKEFFNFLEKTCEKQMDSIIEYMSDNGIETGDFLRWCANLPIKTTTLIFKVLITLFKDNLSKKDVDELLESNDGLIECIKIGIDQNYKNLLKENAEKLFK